MLFFQEDLPIQCIFDPQRSKINLIDLLIIDLSNDFVYFFDSKLFLEFTGMWF
jgi:hypothetical protein